MRRRGTWIALAQDSVLSNAHGFQPVLQQDFTRMDEGYFTHHCSALHSVVIHNLDLPSMAIEPYKAHSPLVVDANTVLSRPISRKRFQAIARRYPQKLQVSGAACNCCS